MRLKSTGRLRKSTAAALAGLAFAAAQPANPALAIGVVSCGPSDYLEVQMHYGTAQSFYRCFANSGTVFLGGSDAERPWITRISTGNNRVQWEGDGRWQPDQPIEKWTVFNWPNHPNGVSATYIRIL